MNKRRRIMFSNLPSVCVDTFLDVFDVWCLVLYSLWFSRNSNLRTVNQNVSYLVPFRPGRSVGAYWPAGLLLTTMTLSTQTLWRMSKELSFWQVTPQWKNCPCFAITPLGFRWAKRHNFSFAYSSKTEQSGFFFSMVFDKSRSIFINFRAHYGFWVYQANF